MSAENREAAVELKGLSKFFGDLKAVDNLSLRIFQGEIFGFLGPNGAGKTTTINMICGLLQPSKGEIYILGHKIKDKNHIKSSIGICPQENIFWPKLTCFEQMVFMGKMYGLNGKTAKSRSHDLLKWLGLAEKSNSTARKLSGGMKRRLSICLALVHDPRLLILDEPEAGLDPQSRVLVRDHIKSMAKEKTIILTTHNMDEADKLSDRVAIIDHGKLLMLNTPSNMKKSIGEGDILEIKLEVEKSTNLDAIIRDISPICEKIQAADSTLIIKSRNLIERVSEITNTVKKHGLLIKEMTMRENSLEDVFIYLTGRKLRQ